MHNTKQSGDPTSTDLERAARQGAAESVRRLLAMAGAWGDVNTTGPLAARWAAVGAWLAKALEELTALDGLPLRRSVGDVERRPDSGLAETERADRAELAGDLDKLALRAKTWADFAGGNGLDVRGWTACLAGLDTARAALEARPAADKPGPLADGYKANFATLLKAVKAGAVCLMSARRQVDGGAAALVCAVNRPEGPDGPFDLVPLAALIDGDPYAIYEDPTAGTGGAGYGTGKDQHKPGPEAEAGA
jgi:hypothetical protein